MNEDTANIPYLPHTSRDREAMLDKIGVRSFEELIAHIPANLRAEAIKIKNGLSELELIHHVDSLASKNRPASKQACFLGGGQYQRYVPSVVPQIVSRSEFATAYTPYQPEVSQGSLQAIYEFQTAICIITGMDVANASMYDGPTACAEAGLMACRVTGRSKLMVLHSVNPEHRMVTSGYAKALKLDYETIDCPEGAANPSSIKMDKDTAGLIVQYPNFFGCYEDMKALSKIATDSGALLIVVSDPISLGLLEAPGVIGADIVVGDAQSCGNFLNFGGPSAGYMACKKEYMRQLPGRLAGVTQDKEGKRAFTLTLQTREQHIRRAKATSNICTNQALNALSMLVYSTMLGKSGFEKLARISLQRAHYLADKLTAIEGVSLKFKKQGFFNEFVLEFDKPLEKVTEKLKERDILAGVPIARMYGELKNCLLVAVTEMNPPQELDLYAETLKEIMAELSSEEKVAGKADKKLASASS